MDINGSCHCGKIRWCFSEPISTVVKCHCEICRRLQGSDYSTWVVIPRAQFKVINGKDFVTNYEPGASVKKFCSICGSPVYLINGKHFPKDVIVALGSILNYQSTLNPRMQTYALDKAEWVEISDAEPAFD
jgi:hypothetical protein